ncbi:MAG: hypothetical protein ACXVZL_01490 [Gaiellaceae bacterium]
MIFADAGACGLGALGAARENGGVDIGKISPKVPQSIVAKVQA